MREDPREIAREAARRERRAWAYVALVVVMIVVGTFGFIWATW